ncbi:hypothetical protein PPE_04887 [Paenibacillus polymyxa E681]|nr:hypothetical protein PPE_04887 [Paenibacillus polymyxa E681]
MRRTKPQQRRVPSVPTGKFTALLAEELQKKLLLGIGFSGSTLLPPVVIREVFGGCDYATIHIELVADTINFSRYSYRSLNIQDIERLPAVPIFLMKVVAFYFISQSCRVSFLTNSSNS